MKSFRGIAALVTGLVWVGCSAPTEPPRNVLLLSVDTLRADHLGAYGYARSTSPSIDRLAAEGVLFEHAVVQWPVTTPSMTSMFSGHYPHVTGVVVAAGDNHLPDRLLMLAEAFRERGYRTSAVVANGVLGSHNNFDQGFETYHELWKGNGDQAVITNAEQVTKTATRELEKLGAGDAPFLLWVHYVDPHTPYDPPDGYAEAFVGDALYQARPVPVNASDEPFRGVPRSHFERAEGIRDLGRYVAAYDGEIRYADEQIGRLLERLEAAPAGDDTLVALVSDHGESLGEHDLYFNHGHVPYEEQVRVPLIFRWPDRRHAGRRIDIPVELRGLARTLLSAVGVPEAENPFGGADLLPAIRTGETEGLPRRVYTQAGSEATRWRRSYTLAVRSDDLKLVLPRSAWARERHGGRDLELFDLVEDPLERSDLSAEHAALVSRMRQELIDWFYAEPPWPRSAHYDAQRADAFTRKALHELGYLESVDERSAAR